MPLQTHIRSPLLTAAPISRLRRARAQEGGTILFFGFLSQAKFRSAHLDPPEPIRPQTGRNYGFATGRVQVYDTVLVGLGRTGAALAKILGQYGLAVLGLERKEEFITRRGPFILTTKSCASFRRLAFGCAISRTSEPFSSTEILLSAQRGRRCASPSARRTTVTTMPGLGGFISRLSIDT
jgi:hypothetical protein